MNNLSSANSEKTRSSRSDTSLFILTKRFLKYIDQSQHKIIDMNHAAQLLKVSKRRIYDITNVLEGLNLLIKPSVNTAKWIGNKRISEYLDEFIDEFEDVRSENFYPTEISSFFSEASSKKYFEDLSIEELKIEREELLIDKKIESLHKEISDLSQSERNIANAYVTYKDLNNLPSLKDKLIFAVKAPQDTVIECAPKLGKHEYVVQLSTNEDRIDVFYASNDKPKS